MSELDFIQPDMTSHIFKGSVFVSVLTYVKIRGDGATMCQVFSLEFKHVFTEISNLSLTIQLTSLHKQ